MNLWALFTEYVLPLLCTAAAAFAIPAMHKGVSWLRDRAKSANLGAWSKLADLAFEETDTAISALQPIADDLKKRMLDGRLSDTDKASLKAQAVAMVETSLKPIAGDLLKKVPQTLIEGWVDHLVAVRQDPTLAISVTPVTSRSSGSPVGPAAPAAVPPG